MSLLSNRLNYSQNIDPEGLRSDAELNDALALVNASPSASESIRDKFRLETEVDAEGSNFSAGEKQLLSLIRALVRGCKVLILDEATSSVDPETDGLIQRIIQTEFADVTVSSYLCVIYPVARSDADPPSCFPSHTACRQWYTMTGSWSWTLALSPRYVGGQLGHLAYKVGSRAV